jgi:hypothetical protein
LAGINHTADLANGDGPSATDMNGIGDDSSLYTNLRVWDDGWANSPDQAVEWKECKSSKGEKHNYHAESNTSQWDALPGWGDTLHSRLSSASSTLPMPADKLVVL